jgi:thiol-disulfide isomerase/thioredoxin
MKKITLLFILSLTITSISYSQSKFGKKKIDKEVISYNITGEIEGLQDTSVILAYYFGGKQYATDTAQSVNGNFTFKGDKELKGGMYLVVLPNQQYFDIIVSENKFSFSTKLNDLVGAMTFKNSKENTPFYAYLKFITQMQKEVTPIRQKMENATGEEKENLQKTAGEIDTKVKNYRANFMKENADVFFTKIVQATTEIEIPESPLDSTGNPDKTFPYRFYKKHFWDNIDFSDQRMLRTPIFFNKMDQYLDKLTAKHPDSINVSADVLVNLSKANGEIFQYVVSYITSTYERSKIMGMDAVFVHMVENYYITKQCDWVDSTQLVKIADRAQKIAPNLIGREASEFVDFYGRPFMKDTSGITHTLQEIKADYTVLVFFGPTCGHCKKEMPKIKHDVDSLVTAGIDIKTFAVATEFDKKEWKKFINTQKTGDWLNVADINHDDEGNPVASSDWRDKYDIYSTPVIYLLDKDKKIIAKRITHTQIVEIIGRLEKK